MENETLRRCLFVCKANIRRSKTGERIFREMLEGLGYSVGSLEDEGKDFYVGSAGVYADRYGGEWSQQYTPELGKVADRIFVADKYVERDLWDRFEAPMQKVVNLEIPDDYDIRIKHQKQLLEKILREKLAEYVPEAKK